MTTGGKYPTVLAPTVWETLCVTLDEPTFARDEADLDLTRAQLPAARVHILPGRMSHALYMARRISCP